MEPAPDRLQRVALKLFLAPPAAIDPRACIDLFHRWIREAAVPGLLIDVADYAHLPSGPRVVLVAHEAHYAIDDADGRPGLVYTRRQPLDGPLVERLTAAAGALLAAAARLERDGADFPGGAVRFRTNEMAVIANDRLAAPAGDAAEAALRPPLAAFGARLFGAQVEMRRADDGGRLALTLEAPDAAPLADLAARLGHGG